MYQTAITGLYQKYKEARAISLSQEQFTSFLAFFPVLLVAASDGIVDRDEWLYCQKLAYGLGASYQKEDNPDDRQLLTQLYRKEFAFLLSNLSVWEEEFLLALEGYFGQHPYAGRRGVQRGGGAAAGALRESVRAPGARGAEDLGPWGSGDLGRAGGCLNPRIQILLDSRDIEELAAADAEVLGMWGKATRTYRSAGVPGLEDDPDARFTLLYQAALQGATAVVRAAGYRVRGDHNHRITFATVAALASGDLAEAARDLNVIRQGRHAAIYDWEATTDPAQVRGLQRAATVLLREAFSWLGTRRPSLTSVLTSPTVPPE